MARIVCGLNVAPPSWFRPMILINWFLVGLEPTSLIVGSSLVPFNLLFHTSSEKGINECADRLANFGVTSHDSTW